MGLVRVTGEHPTQHRGQKITAQAGQSLLPVLRGKPNEVQRTVFWEHMGNAAVRNSKWKLVRTTGKPWELYDLEADRSELMTWQIQIRTGSRLSGPNGKFGQNTSVLPNNRTALRLGRGLLPI